MPYNKFHVGMNQSTVNRYIYKYSMQTDIKPMQLVKENENQPNDVEYYS